MLHDGNVQKTAQPPFLLRYSPAFFALPESGPDYYNINAEDFEKETALKNLCSASLWFAHDATTNRLSLKENVLIEPWLRPPHAKHKEDKHAWLYCTDCMGSLFRRRARLPFRDRASQCFMKPQRRGARITTQQNGITISDNSTARVEIQPVSSSLPASATMVNENEKEDDELRETAELDVMGWASDNENENPADVANAIVDDICMPCEAIERPSLADYKIKWASREAHHARAVPGEFGRDNLVPQPRPRLWQDAPHILNNFL